LFQVAPFNFLLETELFLREIRDNFQYPRPTSTNKLNNFLFEVRTRIEEPDDLPVPLQIPKGFPITDNSYWRYT